MNQTVTANISGVVFHIDVNAYERLNVYLDKIRSYFKNSEESEEIMTDIEARIAELFSAKITGENQVVDMKVVEEVMEVMGKPEQYVGEEDTEEEKTSYRTTSGSTKRTNKKLFRDPDDRMIGGVASGIGAYLGIDAVWLRLFFVVGLFIGFGFLLYIVLWIVMPEARTSADKLNMKGEPVNIENIGKTFEEGAGKVNEKFKDLNTGQFAERLERFFAGLFNMLGTLLKGLFKAMGKILGFGFLVLGILLGIVFIGGAFSSVAIYGVTTSGIQTPLESMDFLLYLFNSEGQFQLAKYALMMVVLIPIVALVYGGIRLLFGIRGNTGIGIGLSVLWVIGILISIFIGIQVGTNFSDEAEVIEYQPVISNYRDYVIQLDDEVPPGDEVIPFSDNDFFFSTDKSNFYMGYTEFTIEQGQGDSIVIEVVKQACGPSMKRSTENARSIEYNFSQNANLINLRSYIQFDKSDGIRAQEATIILKLPVGKVVFLDPSLEIILFDVDNVTGTYDKDMLGRRWIMLEDGLTCLDCQGIEGIKSEELDEELNSNSSYESSSSDEDDDEVAFHFPELITYFISSVAG